MPSDPAPKKLDDHARELAKQRVLRVFREGADWKLAAIHNDLPYATARRAVVESGMDPKQRGGVRSSCVKMTVELMAKLEEYLDEDCRATLTDMCDRLLSDTGVIVSKSSVHRALQGMLYSTKKLRIEKAAMNNSINKQKRKEFVEKLDGHISRGDMIVYQDETNFNLYMSRSEGTHEGSIAKLENARFIADFQVEDLARQFLTEDGIMNGNRLVLLRLGPYSLMLNPIEGCWNVLKLKMRRFMATKKQELLVRGEYDTYTAHRLAIMKEAVAQAVPAITRRLVWRLERHAAKACTLAERGEDMKLGT
ncbi:hypothetical protein PR001_g15506 [Phytophthora rubi]|uniref:Tc1-like transposase DDE domain-containing protein n=1 Tax=Phytophthora rubi TaxID=129364 RepID=A0A6A3L4U0_9STRA|nr:hypothetical protein PR001_g15506 [Phytophthora rubi]